jgi:hypothetical protein
MDFFAVLLILLFLGIVMAMRQFVVVVFVSVPEGPMFAFVLADPAMMVGDVIMIVAVEGGRVRVVRRSPLPFHLLLCHV